MDDTAQTDILVQRLHFLAVRHGLNVKEMAEKCGVPKSSLEGYMRLKGAKRPGIDALIAIADAMDVSIDWLVGRSDGKGMGEAERRQLILAMYTLVVQDLRNIDDAQGRSKELIVADGKIGNREIGDYAAQMMLHFMATEAVIPSSDFETFRIFDEILQDMDD
ncbi:helix-turn-helix domain-containing protein [Primorskyibacter sp. 2E107]|uniref:helix-turn-helix domain-containing protein n=1 Tax=Primorskyibacter sp. 2E107 TaxID=3403458 RepID=UPI003AF76C8B